MGSKTKFSFRRRISSSAIKDCFCLHKCKSFGLLFSDVLIFNLHCLLFSCQPAQFRYTSFRCLHSPNPSSHVCHPASKLAFAIPALPAVLIVYQNLFCMKFSRYKSHPLRGSFRSCFATSSVARQISLTNGDGEIRTLDPLLARQVLSQLSYTPSHAVLSAC